MNTFGYVCALHETLDKSISILYWLAEHCADIFGSRTFAQLLGLSMIVLHLFQTYWSLWELDHRISLEKQDRCILLRHHLRVLTSI